MFDFDNTTGEMWLYSDIMPAWMGGIDAPSVRAALKDYDKEAALTVRLNSAGGSVDEGVAIHNMLKEHSGPVKVMVDSLAASIASYIMLAGDEIEMAENAVVMIHKPWSVAIGDSDAMRKEAEVLDLYERRLLAAYTRRLNMSEEEVQALLAAETWYDANEALAAGLVDSIAGTSEMEPEVQAGRFKNPPQAAVVAASAGSRTTRNFEWFAREKNARQQNTGLAFDKFFFGGINKD